MQQIDATYVEKVKLISSAANRVGKQQQIALQPCYRLRRIFEANTRSRHDNGMCAMVEKANTVFATKDVNSCKKERRG